MRKCVVCHVEIPVGRLEALPQTRTCVECSSVKPVKGSMVFDHKTAPTIEIHETDEEHERFTQASRKGVHASLPLARKDAGPTFTVSERLKNAEAVSRTPARCHPERPAVSYGRCFECALRWYEDRRKHREVVKEKR